jgi:hypothetical protein
MSIENGSRSAGAGPEFGNECLIQAMQTANGEIEGGDTASAAGYVAEELSESDRGKPAKDLNCGRCETSFSVLPNGAVVVKADEAVAKGERNLFGCDQPTGTPRDGQILKLDLVRLGQVADEAA